MKKFQNPSDSGQNVIHMGKKKKKEIERYQRGFGKMHMEVQHVVEQAKALYGEDKEIIPIVIVHKRKGGGSSSPKTVNFTPVVRRWPF